jgi:PhnB protein
MAKSSSFIPKGYHTITPHLMLDNASQSMEWYKKAFGAEEIGRHLDPSGKVIHAEMKIGDSRFMCNDVMEGKGPKAFGGSPAVFWIYVDNSDALFKRAVDAGGKVQVAIEDHFWGDRAGALVDPAGYTWWIATRKEELTPAELEQRAKEHFAKLAPASR